MDTKTKLVVVFALGILIGTAFLSMFTADGSRNSLDDAHVEETVPVKWPYVRQPGSPTVPMSYMFRTDNGIMLDHRQAVMMGLSRKDVWVQDREGDPLGRYRLEERDDGRYDLDVWVEDDARIEMEGLTERPDDLLVRIDSEISTSQRDWYSLFRDLGIEKQFDEHEHFVTDVVYVERRLATLRLFADEDGRMNRSIDEINGALLVVSQFTLAADTRKGRRPSFGRALAPELAEPMIDDLVARLSARGLHVETGDFGASMQVELVNDGPVTIVLDSRETRRGNARPDASEA